MSRTSVSSERIEEFAQELLPLDHRASNDDTQRNEDSEPESESEHSRPPSIQHAKQKPSTAQKIGAYYFVWEMVTMALSAGILIALVVVLAARHNKPQPDWRYVSINSLIAWMTTVSRACILFSVSEALGQLKWVWLMQSERPVHDLRTFDEASRGPFGALGLIWALRGRHFAVLSSLAMILALGFDPFAQNLIRFHQGSIYNLTEIAYTGDTSLYNAYGAPFEMDAFLVEPTLKSNVYNSLFSSDEDMPWSIPRYSCPSTNCTWDPVISLEARMLCANITESLVQSCHNVSETNSARLVNCTAGLPRSEMQTWALLNYTKNSFRADEIHGLVGQAVEPSVALVYTNATRNAFQFIAPWEFKDFSGTSVTRQVSLWEATECSFEPIVRSFQPSVKNNVYSDTTLAIWSDRTLVHVNDTDSSSSTSTSNNPQYTNDTEFTWQFQPPWGRGLGMDTTTNPTGTFQYGLAAEKAIAKFLRILFSGYYWRNQTHEGYQPTAPDAALYAASDVLQTLDRGDLAGCGDNNPISYQRSVPVKVNCSAQNVARAISKTFRDSTSSGAGTGDIPEDGWAGYGRVQVNVTFISVRWQWIALPVLVWVLGAVAVVGAIWKTRRRRAPRWKNDPLPLLFLYQGEDENEMTGEGEGEVGEKKRWVPNADLLKVKLGHT